MALPWVRKTSDVEERLAKVETGLRSLRLESEELQDKVYRWMQRSRVRMKVDEPEPEAPSNGALAATKRILARRGIKLPGEG